MGSKLKDYMEKLDPDTMVCIGSRQAFMYFGRAGDTERIRECFEDYRARSKRRWKSSETAIYNLITTNFEIKLEEEVKDTKRRACKKAEKLFSAMNTAKTCSHYENTYKDPFERNIKERYIREADGYEAILIGGFEMGFYWNQEEFDKDYA